VVAEQAILVAKSLSFELHTHTRGGGSDGNAIFARGIPVLDGLGCAGARDHSPDEYLVLSSVAQRTGLLAWLIASSGELLADFRKSVISVTEPDLVEVL